MNKTFVIVIFLFVQMPFLFAQQREPILKYLNELPPDSLPVIFAKGIISTSNYEHSSPMFSPFYDEIYWSIRINGEYGREIIKYITKEKDNWSEAKVPSFSIEGKGDLYPTFSSDGKELFFTSDRLIPTSADSINRFIWKIKKNRNGWSEPKIVGFDSLDIYGLSISSKGSLYFMAQKPIDRGTSKYDIYTSKIENEKYTTPEIVKHPVSTEYYEDCPFISKDDKFLIFESNRPGGFGKLDLYLSIKNEDGSWSQPKNLGKLINSDSSERFPYISPDGKYFFFGSDRTGNFDIYWINASIIYKLINNIK